MMPWRSEAGAVDTLLRACEVEAVLSAAIPNKLLLYAEDKSTVLVENGSPNSSCSRKSWATQ